MGFDYTSMQATAERLLANYGERIEFRLNTEVAYDPVSGIEEIEYTKSYQTGVSLPSVESGLKFFDEAFLAGLVLGRTKVFIVSGLGEGFEPKVGDQIFYEEKLWDIGTEDINTGVMPLSPIEGSNIIFTIGCRLSGRDPTVGTAIGGEIAQEEPATGFDYNGIQARAESLLANYGEPIQLRFGIRDDYDPILGSQNVGYLKSYRTGVCLPSVESGMKFFDEAFMAGLVLGKTKVFLISGLGQDFEPKIGGQIFYGGKLWDIGTEDINTGVMPLSPIMGSNIIFTVGCRLSGKDPEAGTDIGFLSELSFQENRLRVFVNETFHAYLKDF